VAPVSGVVRGSSLQYLSVVAPVSSIGFVVHGSGSSSTSICRLWLQSPISLCRCSLVAPPVSSSIIYCSWLQYLLSRPVSPVSVDRLWLHWWLSLLVLCLQYQHLQCVSSICQSLVTPVSFPVASGSIGCCFWFHWLSLVAP